MNTQIFQDPLLLEYHRLITSGEAPGNHAIVLGLTLAALSVSREKAIAGELFAFVSNTIAAAVRMVMIDHQVAQSLLHQMKPVIAEVARDACTRGLRDIGGCAPLIDSMAMRHELAEMRLFMS
jgi:urease accessory protein